MKATLLGVGLLAAFIAPAFAQDDGDSGDLDFMEVPNDGSAESKPAPAPSAGGGAEEAPKIALPGAEVVKPSTDDSQSIEKDIQDLESKLAPSTAAPGTSQGGVPSALSSTIETGDDPGSNLSPGDRFARVPLRPQMSDSNWVKWAGPALTKIYRIREGDTLWGISEQLFGNPFLWPKVWQLNAHISNPNVIKKGIELQFQPGNPNSAPELAFRVTGNQTLTGQNDLPFLLSNRKLSLMDFIDDALRRQLLSEQPPFQHFLITQRPKPDGRLPKFTFAGRILYNEGDRFKANVEDGRYSIVRIDPLPQSGGYRLQWLGTADMRQGDGVIVNAFQEMEPGDLLIKKSFGISPLALHEEKMGVDRNKVRLVPLQVGAQSQGAQFQFVGIRFSRPDVGPREGAILTVLRSDRKVATLLVVSRENKVATAWIVESDMELSFTDVIE